MAYLMGKADLHIHTSYSHDSSCTVSAALEWAASATDLDVIAVTDHDQIGGALEAAKRAPEFGIEVVPGMEISTRDGHLLGLWLEKPVLPDLPLLETVLRIGEQGGLAVAAHPTAILAHGLRREAIRTVAMHSEASNILVGIETINTGVFYQKANRNAKAINASLGLSETGSSDSHVFWTIGFGYTEFEGRSAADLRRALQAHATSAGRLPEGAHTINYWAKHILNRMIRRAGWGVWAPEPQAALVLRRLAEIQA